MISCNVIQQLYIDLYRCLRRYIWDFNVIKIIAQLEVLCYTAFSDIHDICNCLNNLYSLISPACSDDDELHQAIVKSNSKKYDSVIASIRKAIDELGSFATKDSTDDISRDAIANLSVILFDLQSAQ